MLQKNKTYYIDTSQMSTNKVKNMIVSLTQKGFKYVSVSDSDIEDNAEYFLAVNTTENICYMDCCSSENIVSFDHILCNVV